MMRKIMQGGKPVAIEYTLAEMAQLLGLHADDLALWKEAIAPSGADDAGLPLYQITSPADLELLRKRGALLRTGMSEVAVKNVEASGHLNAYAALAEDCPEGITAHVWRSYALVVYMQVKHGIKLSPRELAERAGLTEIDPETGERVLGVKMAEKHLRLLTALNYLEDIRVGSTIRVNDKNETATVAAWGHLGLPKAWQGQ